MYHIVIDPCYLATHEEWDTLGARTEWEIQTEPMPYKVNDSVMYYLIVMTANGDGCYGEKICVDSGTLCAATVDAAKYAEVKHLCQVYPTVEKAKAAAVKIAAKI
jgi:hypothetical protein